MRIEMLGPLEVTDADGGAVAVAGARLRALLIELALNPGRLVPTADLVDAIWSDDPPAGASNALQALVSRLRRALPDAVIEPHPAGYTLAIEPDAVDVSRFERLIQSGRAELADRPAVGARTLGEALGLWRGPALVDVAQEEFFQPSVTRLEELRLTAMEDRAGAISRLGRGAELIPELTTLAGEYPLREQLVGALMRALAQAGRQAEALAAYERAREVLADELGADPSPELSALHTEILRGNFDTATTAPEDTSPRTNLRLSLTSFVGRDADVARVSELIGEYRLTTLVGPGGTGKTRLAVEVSRALLDRMPDGAWLVELAPLRGGADLPSAVLSAMDLRDQALVDRESEDPISRLTAVFRNRTALLVLDNCEHLIGSAAALADRLLGECPQLRIMTTSREPLGITGEAVWSVEPLELPPENVREGDAMSYPAVRLLVDRARAVNPEFRVTDDNGPAIAQICRALDGVPLALELAAARLRTMTAEQVAARLDDRFRLLTAGSRTAMQRHQTLRAVIDWSWELLSDAERIVLRRLSVFAGGATQEAVESVSTEAGDVLNLLTALTDKSLLVVSTDHVPRYEMLETIRAYGVERLEEAGEGEDARRAHARFFVELAQTAEPHLRRAEQLEWLYRLEAEHDNINAALRGAIAVGDAQTAVRLVAAAGWYWWLGGHKAEGMELATEALAVPGDVDAVARATAFAMVAYFATAGVGDLKKAEPWVREARQLAQTLDDPGPMLRYMIRIWGLVYSDGGLSAASQAGLEALVADEDPWVRAHGRLIRSRFLASEERKSDLERALAELRSIGERWGICFTLTALADVAARSGDFSLALEYSKEAAVLIAQMGTAEDLVMVLAQQAQFYWLLGDAEGCAATVARADQEAKKVSWPDALGILAFLKSELARWSGDIGLARTELARAEALLRDISVDPTFRVMLIDCLAHLDAGDGDLEGAGSRRAEALESALDTDDPILIGLVLVGVADQAIRRSRPKEAARLLGASECLGGGRDLSRPDGARVEEAVRAVLDESDFNATMRLARKEFCGESGEPATAVEAVRELATSVLAPP